MRTEFHTASAAGVDLYTTSILKGRLQIEHLSHSPEPERPLRQVQSLLRSVETEAEAEAADEDDWLAE